MFQWKKDQNPSFGVLAKTTADWVLFSPESAHLCHHPANSIVPVSFTQNLNYIITTLKSFNIKKYSLF